jgi:ribonuclease J
MLFVADSTNVENPGFSITERQIHENLENIIKNVKGRLIIGTFASQFERMIKIIEIAERYNKKIVTEGRGIKTNIEIAIASGLLKPLKDTLISGEDIDNYPKDRIVVLATGAQGEEFAALMRMANKKHKYIRLDRFDTVILSSSIIPGNEISVRKLKDNLYRHNVSILHYKVSDVHSTGHGNAGELAWINSTIGARYFMPAYGFHSMLKAHAQVARSVGMKDENIIVPDNGTIIEISNEGKTLTILKEKVPAAPFMVDGFSIGNVQDVVIKDRQVLSQDGMFVIVASINPKTGKLKKSPDIISRGFVYLRESQELLQKTRSLIKNTIEESVSGMNPIDFDFVRNTVANNVRRFLLRETGKKPVVIPVILGLT